MDTGKGIIENQIYNNKPVIKGSKKIWFLNGDLVRLYHSSRSTGLVSFFNITKGRLETCLRKVLDGCDQHICGANIVGINLGFNEVFDAVIE